MLTTLLNGFALISLFVGGFVILNTFTVIVAQRTRETGLLRALGASTRQVTSGVLLEALVVGAVASVLGVVAGVGMTVALRWAADALDAGLADGGLVLTPRTLVLPVVIGVALTLVASYVPARRAGRLTPMAALRDVDRRVVVGRLRILAGIVLGVVSPLVGIVGVPLAMVAAALLAPALVPLTARVAGPVLRRVGGVPGRLGAQNAVRNPIRTGATASALTIGLSLVVGMTIVADSTLSSFTTALERSVRSDLIVNSPDADGISPGLADELAGLDEVGAVARMRYGQFELLDAVHPDESGPQELLAVDPATYGDAFDLGVVEGRIPDLADGGVIALDEVADREGWRVGDTVRMRFAGAGVQELRIDGIYTDATLEDQGFVVSITDYERWFSEQLDARVFVSAAPGVTVDAAQGAVERVARRFPGVEVNTAESFIAETTSMIDMVLAAVNVLLGLAVVIAVLGIVNTLALSMHERTRELGLVRAVGMSRRQVRAMVRWESVVMSLLGSALALVVGLVVGRAVLAQVASRFGDQMTFPPVRLAVLVALGAAVGLAAAVLPARQAARTEILDAMRLA
jgi:putative ABC transport system permease protein